eukprot:scaffold170798_cov19-Tisochrysis_lutea.AAC.1
MASSYDPKPLRVSDCCFYVGTKYQGSPLHVHDVEPCDYPAGPHEAQSNCRLQQSVPHRPANGVCPPTRWYLIALKASAGFPLQAEPSPLEIVRSVRALPHGTSGYIVMSTASGIQVCVLQGSHAVEKSTRRSSSTSIARALASLLVRPCACN